MEEVWGGIDKPGFAGGGLESAVYWQSRASLAVPERITNWKTNYEAQEAVLDVISTHEVLCAPHGQSGKRLSDAVEDLQNRWKYIVNERTMKKWVYTMVDEHERNENRLDGETGTEYDRNNIQVSK